MILLYLESMHICIHPIYRLYGTALIRGFLVDVSATAISSQVTLIVIMGHFYLKYKLL